MKFASILTPVLLTLAACQKMPETFAPPEQRTPLEQFRPYTGVRVINMDDGDASAHFVKDVTGGLEANWRWVQKRPTLRLRPRVNQGLVYLIDFTLPEVSFKDTGPVTMSFYVGDHLLESIPYTEPGQKHYEKPVPPEWIVPGEELQVSAEIDKMWTSKEDGTIFGFILTRMGLGTAVK